MNGKILLTLLLIGALIVFWFFYNNRPDNIAIAKPDANIQSEVSDISASQTNPETGKIEYTLTAKSLIQNQAGQNEFKQMSMTWTPPSGEVYEIQSGTAILDNQTGGMMLSDGVVFHKKSSTPEQQPITMTCDGLLGNTKLRQIQSLSPIHITQGEHEFDAQGVKADLNSGDYEFLQIITEFKPPIHNHQALF